MASERVWPAMLEAFTATGGSLRTVCWPPSTPPRREGGDLRGRQSAAILVVPPDGEAWQTAVSLRVEDHPEPLGELRRLVALTARTRSPGRPTSCSTPGRHDEAARLYVEASELAPGNHELMFWAGLGTAQAGDVDGGMQKVRAAIALEPNWFELLPRLGSDVAPSAGAILARLRDG